MNRFGFSVAAGTAARIFTLLSLKRSTKIELWVDPSRIVYAKHRDDWLWYLQKWPLLGCPGSWDRFTHLLDPFREEELRGILLGRRDFKSTPRYRNMLNQLETQGYTRFPRCESVAEIESYYEGLFRLADNMRQHGYKPSSETGAKGDIDVRVDRFGRLLKCGQGTHRLALARILEIPQVLVKVDLVHAQWLAKCVRASIDETLDALRRSVEQPSSDQCG